MNELQQLLRIPLADIYSEFFRRGEYAAIFEHNGKCHKRQEEALTVLQDGTTNELLFGGGARGGKSWIGNVWQILRRITMPESSGLIAREELVKLKDTTLLTFFKVLRMLDAQHLVKFNAQTNIAEFKNGSRIFFREIKYLPSDREFDRLGSYDLTDCFLDEAQQIHPKAVSVLKGRFSVLEGPGWKTIPKSLYTCNPAKGWVFTDFVKPGMEGTLRSDRKFIKSLPVDNPHVGQDYIDNLLKADKITVQRLYHGNFNYDDDPSALMDYDSISSLFKNDHLADGRKYITVDVARLGKDATVIMVWSGYKVIEIVRLEKERTPKVVEEINRLATKYQISRNFIVADEDGVGGGVVDYARCKGFVNGSAAVKGNYKNLRSECYFMYAEKVNNGLAYIKANPAEAELIAEELSVIKKKDVDADEKKLAVISREEIKQLIGRSPDYASALMMRMYFDVKGVSGPMKF